MTQIIESEILYGLENSQRKFARFRIASLKCILLFHTPPPAEFDDTNLEQGMLTHDVNCELFFLRLDLSDVSEMTKLDRQNPEHSNVTDHCLEVRESDGQRHYLLMPSATIREEWFSHLHPCLVKTKTPLQSPLPITGVSPHQPLVIGNPSAQISCESLSSPDSDGSGEEHSSSVKILKGNPQDYPALANWSRSLIRYGYGYKKGAKRKNWKYRFFVLTHHSFAYFESEKKKNPIASFPIDNIISVFQRKDLSGHEFVMAIDTEDRMHLWEFDTEEELRKWLKDFTEHIPIKSAHGRSTQKILPTQFSSSLMIQPTPNSVAPAHPAPSGHTSHPAHHNIVTSLPANLSAAVDPSTSGVVFETKVFDGVVVKKQVIRNGNQKQDSDSDDSGGEESIGAGTGVVSRSVKALQGIDPLVLVKYGYCQKEGGVVHNWKRRFFVLTKGTLSYFKSAADVQAIKCIKVNTIASVTELSSYQGRNNVIVVNTHSRNYYIECSTAGQANEWVEDINRCKEYQDRFKPALATPNLSDVLDQDELTFSPTEDRNLKVVPADATSLTKNSK